MTGEDRTTPRRDDEVYSEVEVPWPLSAFIGFFFPLAIAYLIVTIRSTP